MQNFRELLVWQKSHKLVLSLYAATAGFPDAERFWVDEPDPAFRCIDPSNIAEGCGRSGNGDLCRFLYIALGSASELDYHLELATALGFLPKCDYEPLNEAVVEIKRMLTSLIGKVQPSRTKSTGAGG